MQVQPAAAAAAAPPRNCDCVEAENVKLQASLQPRRRVDSCVKVASSAPARGPGSKQLKPEVLLSKNNPIVRLRKTHPPTSRRDIFIISGSSAIAGPKHRLELLPRIPCGEVLRGLGLGQDPEHPLHVKRLPSLFPCIPCEWHHVVQQAVSARLNTVCGARVPTSAGFLCRLQTNACRVAPTRSSSLCVSDGSSHDASSHAEVTLNTMVRHSELGPHRLNVAHKQINHKQVLPPLHPTLRQIDRGTSRAVRSSKRTRANKRSAEARCNCCTSFVKSHLFVLSHHKAAAAASSLFHPSELGRSSPVHSQLDTKGRRSCGHSDRCRRSRDGCNNLNRLERWCCFQRNRSSQGPTANPVLESVN